jgi:pimeloyl-ACP methyl ester carboxylesterase
MQSTNPHQMLRAFALQSARTPAGWVQFRHAGVLPAAQATHVLLHGIGSASASWVSQLHAASTKADCSVLAWDAPGYGDSTPIEAPHPTAQDYAERLWAWLDALQATAPITLVGHSLGALMAARATCIAPQRVAKLILLAPARGYGNAPATESEQKLADRLANLASLGPEGMAHKRGAAMLSPAASAEQVQFIQSVMAQIKPHGYTQAAHMLSQGDLGADVADVHCPIVVASGSADTITPPSACQAVAAQAQVAWTDLGAVGHACPLEAAPTVTALLGLLSPNTP